MRLPLRHAPPREHPPQHHCAHLEALAQASIGLPLGPAAALLSGRSSRGRHGNALQWHFGLQPHDGRAALDWEDRIEIKLVSVWLGPKGRVVADKLKVCDIAVDPWHKLSNVLWVFADRITRVVVGHRFFWLGGPALHRLARSWQLDPHFEHPDLFVEARDRKGRSDPAYYLSHRWLADENILPGPGRGIFPFDAASWSKARATHGRSHDPLLSLVSRVDGPVVGCPRCGAALHQEPAEVARQGWSLAQHAMPLVEPCALRGHVTVDRDRIAEPADARTREALQPALEERLEREAVWRLADGVIEPEDHLH